MKPGDLIVWKRDDVYSNEASEFGIILTSETIKSNDPRLRISNLFLTKEEKKHMEKTSEVFSIFWTREGYDCYVSTQRKEFIEQWYEIL